MAPLLRKKKPAEEKSYLVLDIENGSVGSGLVRVSKSVQPKLFGEVRITLPLFDTHSSELLAQEIKKAVRTSLVHTGTIASRLRNAPGAQHLNKLRQTGEIEEVALFLGAPWGTPNLSRGKPDFAPGMQQFLAAEVEGFAEAPLSYFSAAGAATFGHSMLYPNQDAIVCIIGGEIIELMLLQQGRVLGYGTLPQGYRTLLRTLKTHAGASEAETLSALRLAGHGHNEPLAAAAAHLGREFAAAAQHLVSEAPVQNIFVIAQEPVGAWVARALARDESLAELFPQGGGVRALKSKHLSPHIMARASAPDHALMLEALYLNALSN